MCHWTRAHAFWYGIYFLVNAHCNQVRYSTIHNMHALQIATLALLCCQQQQCEITVPCLFCQPNKMVFHSSHNFNKAKSKPLLQNSPLTLVIQYYLHPSCLNTSPLSFFSPPRWPAENIMALQNLVSGPKI